MRKVDFGIVHAATVLDTARRGRNLEITIAVWVWYSKNAEGRVRVSTIDARDNHINKVKLGMGAQRN